MVLESIIDPHNAEKKPWHVFFIAIIFTFIAIFVSNVLFPSEISILTIAFITILFVPFFQHLFSIEEKKDEAEAEGKIREGILQRHKQIIIIFSYFFLGIIVATSFVYIFFPGHAEKLFTLQTKTLESISTQATGHAVFDTAFWRILTNNTSVLLLIFLTSILFASGAIFILAWNASVIGVFVGLFIESLIETGMSTGVAYLYGVPLGLGQIIIHGLPEVVAYFLVSIAGGILSVAIVREKFNTPEFKEVFKDAFIFFIVAEFLIILAAWLEVLV